MVQLGSFGSGQRARFRECGYGLTLHPALAPRQPILDQTRRLMNLSTDPGLANTQAHSWQQLAGRFRKAWEGVTPSAGAPDLSDFLPPPENSLRHDALLELIRIDLAMRWRGQQPIGLEEYVERFPDLAAAPK